LRIKKGDNEAWPPLTEGLGPFVWAAVTRALDGRQSGEVEAAYDEVWAEVYRAILDNFEFRSKVSTFATSVACKFCLRWQRRPGKEKRLDPTYDVSQESRRTGMNALIDREQDERLRQCVARLSARDQELLRLKYKDDRNFKEIAELLSSTSAIFSIGDFISACLEASCAEHRLANTGCCNVRHFNSLRQNGRSRAQVPIG